MENKLSFKKWPIIGHQKIIASLQRNILNDKLSHAYLFSGLKGLGKTTVALFFIKSIQCQNQLRPCGICEHCKKIDRNIHPNVIILDKESSIKINEIREIQRKLSLTAVGSGYKICLINNAENLTEEAANSLLKILEEPLGRVVFVLITSNIRKILPTIISRCLVINFLPVPYDLILKGLLNFDLEKKLIDRAVFLSQGRPGIALNYIRHPKTLKERFDMFSKFAEIFNKSEISRFKKFNFLSPFIKSKEKGLWLLDLLLEWYRDLVMIKVGCHKLANNFSQENDNWVKKVSVDELISNINKVKQAKVFLSQNINTRLVLENLVMDL